MAAEDQNREDNVREHSLDELAKGLANGSMSRGRAIKVMGAALLGGVLASIPGVAWAVPPEHSQACGQKKTRCPDGKCADLSSDINNCGACGHVCASPEDLCCNGVCTNVVFDQNNCGACGNVCPEGYICQGRCILPPA